MTLLDTIEHLGDPLDTITEVRRILKPGGRLILNTPDLGSASRRELGKDWAVLSPAEHLSYFTDQTLRWMLRRAGFRSPFVRNLLRFNPDYTHAPSSPRRARWARFLGVGERKKLLENAWLMEYTDLLTVGPGKPAEGLGSIPALLEAERSVVRRVKRFIRGDTLVAMAVKS